MNAKYVTIAIPFFFVAIALELWVSRRQRAQDRYRLPDSIASLSCGVGQQALGPLLKVVTLGAYAILFAHARLFTVSPRSIVAWVVLFFAVDCAYYWFHRASHRINIVWAGHVVHHQSEEYNLTTALRQGWFQSVTAQVFYWPIAILGFPLEMFVAMSTLNTLYQFWIHTRAIKTMGPFELVMNTPSHHRVHHGTNPKYLDKNYAGVLIVWDRLFGTFQREEDEPVYGTVKPLASFNPLWANVEYYAEIARMVAGATTLGEKLYAPFAPPEWRPRAMGGRVAIPEVSRASQTKYDVTAPRGLSAYVVVNFAIVAGVTAIVIGDPSAPFGVVALAAAFVVASLAAWGALFEGKRWGLALEAGRLGVGALALSCGVVLSGCAAAEPPQASAPLPPETRTVCPVGGCAPVVARSPEADGSCEARHDCVRDPAAACTADQPAACTARGLDVWAAGGADTGAATALPVFERACALGDAAGCAYAGRIVVGGIGVTADEARGRALLEKACDDEIVVACGALGRLEREAPVVSSEGRDTTRLARYALEESCWRGYGRSCFFVGLYFRDARYGFPRDLAHSARAYTLGCELGFPTACNNLANDYEYGDGVPLDLVRAARIYVDACDAGDETACANAGYLSEYGDGVPVDMKHAEAMYRFSCARERSSSYGCIHLDMLGAYRGGVPHAPEKAVAKWRAECERPKPDAKACAFLGVMMEDGKGVGRDSAGAGDLMRRACAGGYKLGCDWGRQHG